MGVCLNVDFGVLEPCQLTELHEGHGGWGTSDPMANSPLTVGFAAIAEGVNFVFS